MGQPSRFVLSFPTGAANNIATSQSLGAAGNLTLNGSLVTSGVAVLPQARRVSITSGGSNEAPEKFTITGTNAAGAVISESLTGPGASATVTSQYDYATVTKVSVNGATVGNVTVGDTGTPSGSSPWWLPNDHVTPTDISVAGFLAVGAVTWTAEYTYDDPNQLVPSNSAVPPNVFPMASLTSVSNTLDGVLQQPVKAIRFTINSGTGTLNGYLLQAGLKQ